MIVTLSWETIITTGALLTASAVVIAYVRKACRWIDRQKRQDDDIRALKEEQTIIVYGLLCCLKGLNEKGCNGPVKEAIDKIQKHINKRAHE